MNITPLPSPLPGEHVLAVHPELRYPRVDAGWLARLRPFVGRDLDAGALTAEQLARAGQLRVLGQTLSPGIAFGLDAELERDADGGVFVRITPGVGIVASGEDVVLGRELRIALPSLLPEGGLGAARAALLVLVPVVARRAEEIDPEDPCDRDESEDAFSDARLVDGLEVRVVPWDDAWLALDAATAARNPLAWALFAAERRGAPTPWLDQGLAIGLLGVDSGVVRWLDRHAVARRGGHVRARAALLDRTDPRLAAGPCCLWQAQLLQLVDHLADDRSEHGRVRRAAEIGLGRLPPVGVIPREAIDLLGQANHFFPPTWRLRAAPVPLEQLDGLLETAAALAPLSIDVGEEVLVVAPVPQSVYEPGLLETATVSPEFEQAIAGFVAERTLWLGKRKFVRMRRDALIGAIDGPAAIVPDPVPDPQALEDEGEATIPPNAEGESTYDVIADGDTPRPATMVAFFKKIDESPLFTDPQRDELYAKGLGAFINTLDQRLRTADDAIDFGFLKAQADIYRLRQFMLGNVLGTKLAVSPALAGIAQGETAKLTRENLASLFVALKQKQPPPAPPGEPEPVRSGPVFVERTAVTPELLRSAPMRLERSFGRVSPAARLAMTREGLSGLTIPETGVETLRVRDEIDLGGVERIDLGGGGDLGATPDDIIGDSPIIGAIDFRSVTSTERISEPVAVESRKYAIATRWEGATAVKGLGESGLKVDDLPVFAVPGAGPNGTRGTVPLGEVDLDVLVKDETPSGLQESEYFHDAVLVLEAHIGTLRGFEGRVAEYRALLKEANALLAELRTTRAAIETRLGVIGGELTERRHAIATARALLAEEEQRVVRINARRRAVIEQYVTILAYVRTRHFDGLVPVPELPLDPALVESPVVACQRGHADAPDELERLVGFLREAPLRWFRRIPRILYHLDRVELLHGALVTARNRAARFAELGIAGAWASREVTGRFGAAIAAVSRAQVDTVWQKRSAVATLDLRRFVGRPWLEAADEAPDIVSLGDVIEGDHGRGVAVAQAQRELADITRVATCLWAQVGDVVPELRLAWAAELSQYEAGGRLRALAALPGWRDVPYRDRKEIELLAEWLVDRVDPNLPEALAWMHDLVRVCILLASHAPVDAIIAGHVPVTAPASPGSLVSVAIDPSRVRIGMAVTFFRGEEAIARGLVEDLAGGQARARIAEAVEPTLRLEAGTRARFVAEGWPR
jgi:hypothetical protein